jgi:hypothetical protein
LSEWIFIIEQNFKSCNITSDEVKLSTLANYVKGNALKTLKGYLTDVATRGLQPNSKDFYNLLYKFMPEEAKVESLKNKLSFIMIKLNLCLCFRDEADLCFTAFLIIMFTYIISRDIDNFSLL